MSALLTSLIIGFLALDTTIAFQILISQPIFACPLLGWLLGDPATGFEVGILMQLLWVGIIPAGARKFPEGNLASMVVAVLVIWFRELGYPNLVLTVAVFWGIALSYVGALATVLDRKLNGVFFEFARRAAEKGNARTILLLDWLSVLVYFLMMSTLAFASLLAGGLLLAQVPEVIPPFLDKKFALVRPALLGVGLGFTMKHFYLALRRK